MISDAGRAGYSLVLTAGHCAYDMGSATFVTNWMFIPNFDASPTYACPDTRHGCWTSDALVIHYGFRYAGSFNGQTVTHDWAFAVVSAGGKSGSRLDALGSYPIQFAGVASGNRLQPFGYPAGSPYNGSDLIWCAGNIAVDISSSNDSTSNPTWGIACNQTGGASGGPGSRASMRATGPGER